MSDPFKPSILICKRLLLSLKDFENGADSFQRIKDDTISIADSIAEILPNLVIYDNITSLKRLHLAPEGIRKIWNQLEHGNAGYIPLAIQVLNALLQDLELIKKESSQNTRNNGKIRVKKIIKHATLKSSLKSDETINNPADTLFKEIDRALDFTLPDFTSKFIEKSNNNFIAAKPNEMLSSTIELKYPESKKEQPENSIIEIYIQYKDMALKRLWEPSSSITGISLLFREAFQVRDIPLFITRPDAPMSFLLESDQDVISGCIITAHIEKDHLLETKSKNDIPVTSQLDAIEKKLDNIGTILKSSVSADGQENIKKECHKKLLIIKEMKKDLSQFKVDIKLQIKSAASELESQLCEFKAKFGLKNQSLLSEDMISGSSLELNESKQHVNELENMTRDFLLMLENIRLDLTRGMRPHPDLKDYIEMKKKELEKKIQGQKEDLIFLKTGRKNHWESTLRYILREQKMVSESWQSLEGVQKAIDESCELCESIIPVLVHQQKHKLPVTRPHLQVWDERDIKEFGRNMVMKELQSNIELDQERPELDSVLESLQRCKPKNRTDFEKELLNYVQSNDFSQGIKLIEKHREVMFSKLFQ